MLVPHLPPKACCSYCGQTLRPGYYFCTACAMPHSEVEDVLPSVRPVHLDEETKVRRLVPEAWHLFFCYIGALLGSSIIGLLLYPEEDGRVPLMVLGLLAVAGISLGFGIVHRDLLRPQFAGLGLDNRIFLQSLLLLGVLLLLNFTWHGMIQMMVPDDLKDDSFGKVIELIPFVSGRVALICIMPAIFEEMGFRGLLQTWLMRVLSPWKAIALAGALFSAVHFSVLSAPYLLLAGCLFGWVRWRTGKILPSMVLHFLHNLAVLWYGNFLY